jgi:hypothetical protein
MREEQEVAPIPLPDAAVVFLEHGPGFAPTSLGAKHRRRLGGPRTLTLGCRLWLASGRPPVLMLEDRSVATADHGGGPHPGLCAPDATENTWADDHAPLEDLAGIVLDPEHETAMHLLDTEYMTQEWELPPKQVLLSGDGHYWITLDYRNGPEPSVAWSDVDWDEDVQNPAA